MEDSKKETLGVSTKRSEDFSKWYLDVVRKGGFIDQRSPIKGFDVVTPWGYAVWEMIQKKFDELIKKNNVKNAYFPVLIPESLLKKEEEHFSGFSVETAMVTEVGDQKLEERLALRPTSETIMYYMYSLWIRSHQDLPLKINQWNNVVRWDTKVTKPFIRGREFLWQEGHTAHATEEDALVQIDESKEAYEQMYRDMALASLKLVRPKSDTFAGADFSLVFDTLVQDGKVAQGPDCHMLGQNFSKVFDIQFTDKDGQKKNVWQTSWGMSTRQLGILIMAHGDDKGAVLPPELAPIQVVIVPILFKGSEEKVMAAAMDAEKKLSKLGYRVKLDVRDYSAGFKFNEWELKGVPLRLEIGPKDIEANEMTVVRRMDGEKAKIKDVKEIKKLLKSIQKEMLKKSEKFHKDNIKDAKTMDELKKVSFGIARANWCGSEECEDWIKSETGGAEVRGALYGKKEKTFGACVYCGKKAEHVIYVAKSY